MAEEITLWGFLAGLGLFLLGMFMLEQGLRGLGSRSMREFIRQQTRSPVRGVFTGTIGTTILQSSSLVGLITLAFVGAGMLELRNAVGIVIGSNLGTTFTGWIVALLGFKLDLIDYAQPLLALGAFGTVFLRRSSRPYFYSNILLGLGLLLMGLNEMTSSFAMLASSVDASFFHGHNLFFYFIIGAIFTALIQSSSIAMMIVLSGMHAGAFTLQEAAPIIIGADLGTTSTILLGALKGTREKRQVAASHFFYNILTATLALMLMPVILLFITDFLGLHDPMLSVVMFHSTFNLLGVSLFIPFINHFIRFLNWFIPEDEIVEICAHTNKVSASISDAAIEAVNKDLFALLLSVINLNLRCFKVNKERVFPADLQAYDVKHLPYEDEYGRLKRAEGEMLGYTYMVQSNTKVKEELSRLTRLNHAVRNASYAAKFIKDIRHNLTDFRHSPSSAVSSLQDKLSRDVTDIYHQMMLVLQNRNPELATENFSELKTYIRQNYENFIQSIYAESGEDRINDMETSSSLNVNRAFYLSNMAILESLQVLLLIPDDQPETTSL